MTALEGPEAITAPQLAEPLADTNIHWHRSDKTRFHVIGAILFTAQCALLHPTSVVKTRMQVDGSGLSNVRGISIFTQVLKADGIRGIFRGFGTSAIGSIPGRVLVLSSLEMSKDLALKYLEGKDMPEATRLGIANGVAGVPKINGSRASTNQTLQWSIRCYTESDEV